MYIYLPALIILINYTYDSTSTKSLKLRHGVASLSLFYRYYFGRCSEELNYCVPGPKYWESNSWRAASSLEYCVEVCDPRIDHYGSCFFPFTCNLWKSLPPSTFPSSYDLSSFKSWVYRHLVAINYQ